MNGVDSSEPTVSIWLSPDMWTMDVATRASAVPVAVKVMEVIPETVAVTVLVPADEPSVSVDDARPFEPVVTEESR